MAMAASASDLGERAGTVSNGEAGVARYVAPPFQCLVATSHVQCDGVDGRGANEHPLTVSRTR
jgi:hypothetical protein